MKHYRIKEVNGIYRIEESVVKRRFVLRWFRYVTTVNWELVKMPLSWISQDNSDAYIKITRSAYRGFPLYIPPLPPMRSFEESESVLRRYTRNDLELVVTSSSQHARLWVYRSENN